MQLNSVTVLIISLISTVGFTQFAPPAGEIGTTAIHKDSSIIINWASEVIAFERGLADIANPDGELASFGEAINALGIAEGTSTNVVSLGDKGSITLSFPFSIRNDEGPDFAIFENSFSNNYLEFAHVEVSSDGIRFVRIPSISNIPTETQTGSFALSDASLVHNLAGKYQQGYGTPFDLNDIIDSTDIDLNAINFVRIIDVVGSIDPLYGTKDSEGNLINDPYKTDFESGGFDLDAVAVIHSNNPSIGIESNPKNELIVYPNPTRNQLFIKLANTQIKNIKVIDQTGGIRYTGNQTTIYLQEYGISTGFYFLLIEDENGNLSSQKITVIR